ncbi:MAG: DNA methyltransferase [Candidatus Goldiibacteriota bacterium HGW-Goldbacteria-1]|jgi:DNA adenine methylase|nr:MAG: DNA methyltransferase [Candidatus Goldiibacteriota bacterium HGW-Goldbacteria-1]
MRFLSPLRYPGGKGKIADYIKTIVSNNGCLDGTYIEPYAGGASVALSLLFSEYVKKIVINDFDNMIYSFWHSVLYDTERLCKLINDSKVNVETWKKMHKRIKRPSEYTLLNLGFTAFYLNRTNRSGIIKGGVIGGTDQKGKWKIDARFNKKELISRIEKIARYKSRIEISNCDAITLIKKLKKSKDMKTILYLDPPYFVQGHSLYMNYYKPEDHKQIAEQIFGLGEQKWIVSYDDVKEIRRIYSNYKSIKYKLHYSSGEKKTGNEIMFFSDNIIKPKSNFIRDIV